MEPPNVDPYAPPKSALTGTNNTTYLDQDGYAFQNELVANQHFKSPLICAKLGTPISAESNPEQKLITVKRIPRVSQFINYLISVLSFSVMMVIIVGIKPKLILPAALIYLFLAVIGRRITTQPYQIPFYLSEDYNLIRARRALILLTLLVVLLIICIFGIITNSDQYTFIPIPIAFIALVIYKYTTTYFVVTQTKGEFHYIRGVHRNLLNTLPYLPISG